MENGVYESKLRPCRTRDRLLQFLILYRECHGYSPSIREMAAAVGVRSTCTVSHHLSLLEENRIITHTDGKCRDFTVTTNCLPVQAIPGPAMT